jgi:hypothetical protein
LNIYNQLLKNLTLNTNLTNLQVCSNNSSQSCSSDFDCADGGTCQADKNKVRRDLKRVMDQNTIKSLLNSYAAQNNNSYPSLAAGSFLRNYSASIWSRSWNSELGNALGTALPVDPLNQIKSCPVGVCSNNKNVSCSKDQDCVDNGAGSTCALYEQSTCWNRAWLDFQCPAGSSVYLYSWANGSPKLYSRFEYLNAVWKGTTNISVGSATLSNPCGSSNCQCFNYSLNVK